ncbi:MAG TPA: hypothetical protein PKK06_16290 [Phycisphaerae bacterium]|nr:hypothetical protein [Phycisphaerae bacterium]
MTTVVACAAGCLLFLRLVADDVAHSTVLLRRLEQKQRRLQAKRLADQQRQATQTDEDDVPVLEAA